MGSRRGHAVWFYCMTCPKCAKVYNNNPVVGLVELRAAAYRHRVLCLFLDRVQPMLGNRKPINLAARHPTRQIVHHIYQMPEFTVGSYNIHKAVGTDRRRDPARTAAVIAEIGADIPALQEADMRFGSRKGFLDLEAMRRDLQIAGQPLRVISAHLGLLPRSRTLQTRALMDKLSTLDDRPPLLMVHLNQIAAGRRVIAGTTF